MDIDNVMDIDKIDDREDMDDKEDDNATTMTAKTSTCPQASHLPR